MTARKARWAMVAVTAVVLPLAAVAEEPGKTSSYAPVAIGENFTTIMARMKAAKVDVEKRQTNLLQERYDLSDRPAKGVAMSKGKPIQEGVR